MFNVGDLIVYSGHGVCKVDGISEKTMSDVTKHYYDLHPLNGSALKISVPVDNKSILMLNLIDKEEAEELINQFRYEGIEWIEKHTERQQVYSKIVNTGDRKGISKVANTLIRKKQDLELINKKLINQDQNLLNTIQSILFIEMAITLKTTYEDILDRVYQIISDHDHVLVK